MPMRTQSFIAFCWTSQAHPEIPESQVARTSAPRQPLTICLRRIVPAAWYAWCMLDFS